MSQSGHIIIIDDEIDMCWVLERLLTRHGYQVNTATSGESGLDFVRSHQADVAIIDCKLPDMDGLAVAAESLRLRPQMHLILISGFPFAEESQLQQQLRQLNAHFFAKPFENSHLVDLVMQLSGEQAA